MKPAASVLQDHGHVRSSGSSVGFLSPYPSSLATVGHDKLLFCYSRHWKGRCRKLVWTQWNWQECRASRGPGFDSLRWSTVSALQPLLLGRFQLHQVLSWLIELKFYSLSCRFLGMLHFDLGLWLEMDKKWDSCTYQGLCLHLKCVFFSGVILLHKHRIYCVSSHLATSRTQCTLHQHAS